MTNSYPIQTGSFTGAITINETIEGTSGDDVLSTTTQIRKNVIVERVDGSNIFQIGSSNQFTLEQGRTYIFDQSDPSNKFHPLKFSTVADGIHGGGEEYSVGVTVVGVPGELGAYTAITPTPEAPSNLSYYCANHSGMGNELNLIENMNVSQIYDGVNGVDSGSLIKGGEVGRGVVMLWALVK